MTAWTIEVTEQDANLAWMAALAVSLMWAESALPSPIPGIKPGLANIVTLLVLRRHGLMPAIWVSGLRIVAGSLLLGSFLTPGFVLSCAGASASLLMLTVLYRIPKRWLGMTGLSIAAAFSHTAAQLTVVSFWLMPQTPVWALSPLFFALAWLAGLVNGILAERWWREEYLVSA